MCYQLLIQITLFGENEGWKFNNSKPKKFETVSVLGKYDD